MVDGFPDYYFLHRLPINSNRNICIEDLITLDETLEDYGKHFILTEDKDIQILVTELHVDRNYI
jgi:hypothetical protein